jgi:hypothetical protein
VPFLAIKYDRIVNHPQSPLRATTGDLASIR